ncbi:MAG: NADH-quinone oxidoreductase subunit H [SAR202 cluster bacterium Io17-Chloro-G3]|nr:MAG: NADH-quinone oxidoreductase subunit H [SAR202 cluster bacterium Io17-Chloro-G3]
MPSLLEGSVLFRGVYCWLSANQGNAEFCTPVGQAIKRGILPAGWEWVGFLLAALSVVMLVVNVFMVLATFYTYAERRIIGRFQGRLGPNRAGPQGILQPIADAIKLLTKEDLVPRGADKIVFNLAPIVMLVPVLLVLAVIPFGKDSYVANLNIGVLFVIAVTSVNTLAMFMAGWASGNRYAMFGGMRAVAQLISYEVPVVLSIVGILLLTGSLSMVTIVEEQRVPFILVQPLAFFIFIAGSSAELNRSPFDLVEADSELIAGYHTEYSGMKFGLFQLAEFAAVLTTSGVMATLFLKGWEGPFLPSHVWFLLKVFFFAFVMIWVRATLPRLRVDQVMAFAWKFLFPLSLINIFVTAAEVLIWKDPTIRQLWAMSGINMLVLILGVILFSLILRQNSPKPNAPVFVAPVVDERT